MGIYQRKSADYRNAMDMYLNILPNGLQTFQIIHIENCGNESRMNGFLDAALMIRFFQLSGHIPNAPFEHAPIVKWQTTIKFQIVII